MSKPSLATTGVAVTLLVVVAVLGAANPATGAVSEPVKTEPVRDWVDYVVAFGQPVAVLAAFGSLVLLFVQIKGNAILEAKRREDTAAAEARQHTADLHERYLDQDFARLLVRVSAFLEVTDAGDAVRKIHAWQKATDPEAQCLPRTPPLPSACMPSRLDVYHVLSFFESIGATVDQLDTQTLLKTLGPNPAYLFARGWWHVCWQRDGVLRPQGAGGVYSEYEELVRVLFDLESAFQTIVPNRSVRLLALPAKAADDADWDLCARLSQALSDPAAQLDRILSRPAGLGAAPGLITQVIAVPTDLSFNLEAWGVLVDQASDLQERLQAMDRSRVEDAVAELRPGAQ